MVATFKKDSIRNKRNFEEENFSIKYQKDSKRKSNHGMYHLMAIASLTIFVNLSDTSYGKEQAYTPEKVLPNGIDSAQVTNPYTGETGEARKGTVAATMNNVVLLNNLFAKGDTSGINEIVDAIRVLIPSLKWIGIFDFFTPLEWLSADGQPGRLLVAILMLQTYPKEITHDIKEKLIKIREHTTTPYIAKEIDKTLAMD